MEKNVRIKKKDVLNLMPRPRFFMFASLKNFIAFVGYRDCFGDYLEPAPFPGLFCRKSGVIVFFQDIVSSSVGVGLVIKGQSFFIGIRF